MPIRLLLPTRINAQPHEAARAFAQAHARGRRKSPTHKFQYPAEQVGATPDGNVTVYYDPALGTAGATLARQILQDAPKSYGDCQTFFGISGKPINVVIAPLSAAHDGSGGAYHLGCNFSPGGDLYIDAAFGNPVMTNGLVVAELTESFMGAQNKGWDCGGSNGEALSRFLAELESGGPKGALAGFATGPDWQAAGRPNWIDATDPTDRHGDSTGCGVVYLYWMVSLGKSPADIAKAGCPDGTLASNYAALIGKNTAWQDFSAAVAALPDGVDSDDPWHAAPAIV